MHSPKLRPVIIQKDDGLTRTLRWGLLVWAVLRFIVSVLCTGTVVIGIIGYLRHLSQEKITNSKDDHTKADDNGRLWIFLYAILIQLVEFGMLVTFITAGIKKSVKLYRAYYRYCILTLIIYAIAVPACFALDGYGLQHHFIEVYLTYHIDELPIIDENFYFYVAFFSVAIFDIVLETLLILSIKKLIQRYSFAASETV